MITGSISSVVDGEGVGLKLSPCEMLGVGVMLGEMLGVLVGVLEGLLEFDGRGVLLGRTLNDGVVVGLGVNLYHLGLHAFPIFIAALYITPILII